MSTFQFIVDAFVTALRQYLPVSPNLESAGLEILHWPKSLPEMQILGLVSAILFILAHFRYDWLGLISALIQSIARPKSLAAHSRTLDQHTLLFILLSVVPTLVLRPFTREWLGEQEYLYHPLVIAGTGISLFAGFYFSRRWNRRTLGLNHLKLGDSVLVAALSLLSLHPAIPLPGLLWIAFAFQNYHFEAIFKYSMLILGVHLTATLATQFPETGISQIFSAVGHLNTIAVLVVIFTTLWMTLENLQKRLSEQTFIFFQYFSLVTGGIFVILFFLGMNG